MMWFPLAHVVAFWRPGSADWTWLEEYEDLFGRDGEKTRSIMTQVQVRGIGFADDEDPITLGNDGRVWGGHHRICVALRLEIPRIPVRVVPARDGF